MLKKLVHNYEYLHTTAGILGNIQFVIGSVLFLDRFSDYRHLAVWLFISGSSMMLIGALGSGLKKLWRFIEDKNGE